MGTPSLLDDKKLYSQLCNLVNGALASCVKDHGEVVIGSASKRIVGQLLGALQEGNLLTQSMQNAMSRDLGKMKSEHMAELAALEADARRYRWLREEPDRMYNDNALHWSSEQMDAAIDAALSQEPGGK